MEHVLATQAHLIDQRPIVDARQSRVILRDRAEDLGQDDHLLARDVVLLQRLADDDLRFAVRIGVRRVPGVDAGVVGGLEQLYAVVLVQDPRRALPLGRPEQTATEDDLGDLEAAVAEPFGRAPRRVSAGAGCAMETNGGHVPHVFHCLDSFFYMVIWGFELLSAYYWYWICRSAARRLMAPSSPSSQLSPALLPT